MDFQNRNPGCEMPGGSIRGSSPVHCGVGAYRGTALMLAPTVGVGATRGTAADGDEAWQFTKSRVLRRRLSRFSPKDHQLPNYPN